LFQQEEPRYDVPPCGLNFLVTQKLPFASAFKLSKSINKDTKAAFMSIWNGDFHAEPVVAPENKVKDQNSRESGCRQ